MEFFCEREKVQTNFSECLEYCEEYQNCKADGYLEAVRKKHGWRSRKAKYGRELALVRKWIERAWDSRKEFEAVRKTCEETQKIDPYGVPVTCKETRKYQGWYRRKRVGSFSVSINENDPFYCDPFPTIDEVAQVLTKNGYTLDAQKVYGATENFFINKGIWENNPEPAHYRAAYKDLASALSKTLKAFEKFNCNKHYRQLSTTFQREKPIDIISIDDCCLQIVGLQTALSDMAEEESNKLAELDPLYRYILRLADIYTKETGQKPTASDGQTSGEPSQFVLLVHTLLKNFHREVFYK